MKKKDLLKLLKPLSDNDDVCILDDFENEAGSGMDSTSDGIYPDFDVEIVNQEEDINGESMPLQKWAALSFASKRSNDVKYITEEDFK